MRKYYLVDLKREFKSLEKELAPVIRKIFEEGNFTLGEELEQFEKNYADYCGTKYCVGTSSGTTALFFAIKSLGIKEDDEIIIPTLTFTATAEAVIQAGAKPVFVDIKEDTLLINSNEILKKITKKTKAIIGVHLYGLPVDIDEIKRICKKNKIFFIEDACQAHGANYNGSRAGSFGDIACFSFMAAKNLNGPGDGGCLVTNNKRVSEFSLLLRNHGRKSKHNHVIIGYSGRLDNLKATLLNLKLKHLDGWNARRNEIANLYKNNINSRFASFQHIPNDRKSAYCHFVVRVRGNRNRILEKLKGERIMVSVHYPKPLHLQKAYSYLKYKEGDFPTAEKVCNELISLPMHPFLKNNEVVEICSKLNKILEKEKGK